MNRKIITIMIAFVFFLQSAGQGYALRPLAFSNGAEREAARKAASSARSFDLEAIRASLKDVQAHFPEIQKKLTKGEREYLTDRIIENLICAYRYLNKLLEEERDLTPDDMLKINSMVFLGEDPSRQVEFHDFLHMTGQNFAKNIEPLWKWYERHKNEDPYEVAAGVYARILGRPQLFIEGNHRSGALIASFMLVRSGNPPFVLNTENAVDYFELSSDIKFDKKDVRSHFGRIMGWKDTKKDMAKLLKKYASDKYLVSAVEATAKSGSDTSLEERHDKALEMLKTYGQEHLLVHWSELDEAEKKDLLSDIESADWQQADELYDRFIVKKENPLAEIGSVIPSEPVVERREEAAAKGEEALLWGAGTGKTKLSVIIVAGGRGQRLGYKDAAGKDLAKGMFPAAPLSGKSLYRSIIEKSQAEALARGHREMRPLVFMVSRDTESDTISHIMNMQDWEKIRKRIVFVRQKELIVFNAKTGKAYLKDRSHIDMGGAGHGDAFDYVLNPDEHAKGIVWSDATGGFVEAEVVGWLRSMGVEYCQYMNVDNLLTPLADKYLLGEHILSRTAVNMQQMERTEHRAHISLGVIRKTKWNEQLGIFEDSLGNWVIDRNGRKIPVDYRRAPVEIKRNCKYGDPSIRLVTIESLAGSLPIEYLVETKPNPGIGGDIHKFERISDNKPRYGIELAFESEDVFSPIKNPDASPKGETPAISRKLQSDHWKKMVRKAYGSVGETINITDSAVFELPWAADDMYMSSGELYEKLSKLDLRNRIGENKGLLVQDGFTGVEVINMPAPAESAGPAKKSASGALVLPTESHTGIYQQIILHDARHATRAESIIADIWPNDFELCEKTYTPIGGTTFKVTRTRDLIAAGDFIFITEEEWKKKWLTHKDALLKYEPNIIICRLEADNSGLMSFPSKEHTILSILLMQAAPEAIRGKACLDCGAGFDAVLSVLAVRLGAKRVTAIEHNYNAVNSLPRFVNLNGAKSKIDILGKDFDDLNKDDIYRLGDADTIIADISLYQAPPAPVENGITYHHYFTKIFRPSWYLLCGVIRQNTGHYYEDIEPDIIKSGLMPRFSAMSNSSAAFAFRRDNPVLSDKDRTIDALQAAA